ncbi:hypothetical protein DSO57_1023458 [Entomophthora muscae]|uniref:Uncharacterized protein n=1 Tax=Entomophthora muscae TaxID=34485 RepID=A0ACC2S4W4_9FUNG|nr:hypothetical protein DSO57_1023458 [Entomophthora muscae]
MYEVARDLEGKWCHCSITGAFGNRTVMLKWLVIGVVAQGGCQDIQCGKNEGSFPKTSQTIYNDFVLGKFCQHKDLFAEANKGVEILKVFKDRLSQDPVINDDVVFYSYSAKVSSLTKHTPLNQSLVFYADLYKTTQESLHFLYFSQLANIEALAYTARDRARELISASDSDFYEAYQDYKQLLKEIKYITLNATFDAQQHHQLLSAHLSREAFYAHGILMKLHRSNPH